MVEFHQTAAALYLAAGVGAWVGLGLGVPRMLRGARWGLGLGAIAHGLGFATLHLEQPTPALTDLPAAVSLMVWMAVVFLLFFMARLRLPGLVAVTGPVACVIVFTAGPMLHSPGATLPAASGSWPHAHVLLGSAGLALLGVAGLAGLFFLIEHRRIKHKRPLVGSVSLPSLEALDRLNVISLSVGFPLLTLGVITGMFWLDETFGVLWKGTQHETWTLIAWAIYAGLALARFVGNQAGRPAAASAVGGFAFLVFAVIGVELLT